MLRLVIPLNDNPLEALITDELSRFSELVADLYDAAAGNSSFWPLGARIAAELGSASCSLNLLNGSSGTVRPVSWTDNCAAMVPGYNAHYHSMDLWAQEGAKQPVGQMVATQDFIADEVFYRSEFYQDCCRPFDMFRALGAVIPLNVVSGAVGMISIHRSKREAPFEDATKRRGTLLLSHIQRALRLQERLTDLELQQRALSEATATLGVALMIVSADAQIVFANPAAEALLRNNSGIRLKNGRLATSLPATTDALRYAIKDAVDNTVGRGRGASAPAQIFRQNGPPLAVSIFPFPAVPGSGLKASPMALVLINDPEAFPLPKRRALGQMYGLTAAEAKLYEALLTGDRIQEYAEKTGVSVQTVKTQLAQIFRKTGFSRQSELVRHAMSNPLLRIDQT